MAHKGYQFRLGWKAAGALLCTIGFAHSEHKLENRPQKPKIFAWGQGAFGKLGLGSDGSQYDPKEVVALDGLDIKELRTGKTISACIDGQGNVLTWGKPINGLLGYGTDDFSFNQFTPQLVEKTLGLRFKQISVGNNHVLGVTETGEVYSWGTSDNHKLGHSHIDKLSRDLADRRTTRMHGVLVVGEPKKIEGMNGIKQVEAGLQYSLFVTEAGQVMVMGASSKGALGLGDDTEKAKEVVCLTGFNGIKVEKVVCGSEFNVAIDSAGQVYSWGLNNYGQLGNTSKLTNSTPKILHGFGGKKVIDVACGDTFCLALTSEGEVFSWGCGSSGQLGQGNSMDLSAPRKISTPWRAVSISCGEAHAGTVNESGQLFMFGSGRDGQIGRGSHSESPLSNRLQPVLVDFFDQRGLRVEKVVCGGNQSFAFASAGSLAGETAKGGAKK